MNKKNKKMTRAEESDKIIGELIPRAKEEDADLYRK